MKRVFELTSVMGVLCLLVAGLPTISQAQEKAVNINTASVEQLSLLPRVGSVVAQRIVDFRDKNGRFKTLEELMLVQGVGEKTFELIRPHITLAGETTLTEKVKPPKKSVGGDG
jgi:competence ComEA-like helix-hairpin-helix protein